MRTYPRLPLLLLLLSAWTFPLTAFAQQETATMTGTVRDPFGAIMPKATVTVTNIRTNISVKAETDDAGFYLIPSLRPGDYSVSAESAGFSKIVRTGVTLQVAQVARIDLILQPGFLEEQRDLHRVRPGVEVEFQHGETCSHRLADETLDLVVVVAQPTSRRGVCREPLRLERRGSRLASWCRCGKDG